MTPEARGRRPARRSLWLVAIVLVAFLLLLAAQVLVRGPDGSLVPGAVPGPAQAAYNGPHPVPGMVQAEDYDSGGPGVAYSDSTPENIGGAGRLDEAVDVRLIDGITDVAYVGEGEWTEYTVEVAAGGRYTANLRLGAIADGREVVVSVDGTPACRVAAANTGSYQTYRTVSAPLELAGGEHVVRLGFATGHVSIDWFEIVSVSATPGEPGPSTGAPQPPTDIRSAYVAGMERLDAMRAAYRAWAVPVRTDLAADGTDVRTVGLAGDGAADCTAALQALLDAAPPGATLYFPAGAYRIDGPVGITRPVTLLGEPGTVFDCARASSTVFTINREGSLSSRLAGVTITGVVIEGPGVETEPAMIDGYYLQGFRVSYVRFHNVGYAAVRIKGCTGVVVEDCVFDNVFMKGYGYGVAILDYSDDVTVRDSFFVTRGRHGVTTGTANNDLDADGYAKRVTVENNYMEYMTDQAIDAHDETAGPYLVRRNAIVDSRRGVNLRNGIADISENVFVDCPTAIILRNSERRGPGGVERSDRVVGNIIINTDGQGMELDGASTVVTDNIVLDAVAGGEGGGSSPQHVVIAAVQPGNWTDGIDSPPGLSSSE